jgi:hypothetical protein
MMEALDDSSPLSHQEEEGKSENIDRADDGEVTVELYQHNKTGGTKQIQNMALGTEDSTIWDWMFQCFGCLRKGSRGTNFERIHLGEKNEFVVNSMSESRGSGRESQNSSKSFGSKDDR